MDLKVRMWSLSDAQLSIPQPACIHWPLRQHQKTMVAQMTKVEQELTEGITKNSQVVQSKLAIWYDPPGSGKSVSLLTLSGLHQDESKDLSKPVEQLEWSHQNPLFRCGEMSFQQPVKATLILAPPSSVDKYKKLLAQTTLSHVIVLNKKRASQLGDLDTCQVVVCGASQYMELWERWQHLHWHRIIVDEAEHLRLPLVQSSAVDSCRGQLSRAWHTMLHARFVWIVTSSPDALFENMDRFKQVPENVLFPRHLLWHLPRMWIPALSWTTAPDYLQQSLALPPVTVEQLLCSSITFMVDDQNHPARDVLDMVPDLVKLHLDQDPENVAWKRREQRLSVLKAESEEPCCVCLGKKKELTVVLCCLASLCQECLDKSLAIKLRCPLCLTWIHPQEHVCRPGSKHVRLSKMDTLMKHLIDLPVSWWLACQYRVLVYVNSLHWSQYLQQMCLSRGIPCVLLDAFQTGHGIAIYQDVSQLSLVDLSTCERVYFLSKATAAVEMQTIQACQRINRSVPLHVFHLLVFS